MSPLYKRLRQNTAILSIQSGRSRLTSKKKSQDQPSLPNAYNMDIEQSINKALKRVDFNIRCSGNGSGSGRGSYDRSDITCHKCGKKVHIHKDCRSKLNVSSGNSTKNSTNQIPEWVTKKPVVSDTKDLTMATMTCNNNKYKQCTSCNNGWGEWIFHWKYGHEEWKVSKSRIHLFVFPILPKMQ